MQMARTKKVLVVIGKEQPIEHFIQKNPDFNLENSLLVQNVESIISPFGDVMRDIIVAVYEENIEEIFVVGGREIQSIPEGILRNIQERKEMKAKIQTLDYLFKNCMPEFTESDIGQWLAGRKPAKERVQKSAEAIRKHPLMPANVKVRGLVLDQESKQLLEIRVS